MMFSNHLEAYNLAKSSSSLLMNCIFWGMLQNNDLRLDIRIYLLGCITCMAFSHIVYYDSKVRFANGRIQEK